MALADHLQLRHSTLFQVSAATALVEGLYEKGFTASYLMRHGDFRLGTFADLNSEMTVIDGHRYQTGSTFHLPLPETAVFFQADLTRDPTQALDKVER